MLKKTFSTLLLITSIIFSSCSADEEYSKEEEKEKEELIYTIELDKFDIVVNGDYHNRQHAKGNTIGINKALIYAKENGYKRVKFPEEFYPIMSDWGTRGNAPINEDTVGIVIPSDMTLDLQGATFRLLPNSCYSYAIFLVYNAENINIIGGHIIGDRYEHKNIYNPDHPGSNTYEWGYGISVTCSKNIVIQDMNIEQMTGDAISIARFPYTPEGYTNNRDILVKGCDLHDCRRAGMSITKGIGIEVNENKIHNIKNGTLPMVGIIIEELTVSKTAEECLYIKICNSHFWDVSSGAIACNTGDYIDIYNNIVDNFIEVLASKEVYIFKNTFTNNNGAWIVSKNAGHLTAYDNIFPSM